MFKRLLIANRGEIAIRIIRACQELGIETVAVYSDADANALHAQLADQALNIGPADATRSYLNIAAILDAAQIAEADAIHPGYGFLSENADFAEAVTGAGMIFVGPRADTIRKVGNKDAARELMKQAGLPMTVGSDPVNSVAEALSTAQEIGYPVIIKPIAGGGGKSMFVAKNDADIQCAAHKIDFSTGGFYLEKYIADARHIEVQIVADNYGDIIHLGERECSIQRRNQKILEEAPSVAVTPEMRQKVGALAIRAAKSAHYTNVGTVEFLMDKHTGEFYFMEINPRIQVEHAITERTTGIDLVKTQLKIASGEPLHIRQENVRFIGHAIECRINAEDPHNSFLPCPGQITFYHQPGGPNARVDSGVCAGSIVQPHYDSLIAKVIAHGNTRGEAIKVMQRALAEYRITGICTTIGLHMQILKNPYFCSGDIDTQFVAKHMSY
ncbi:Biotin carboxylase 1 [Propionispora sp. 2/2-37]|uniref:acetyl-CoA carboxylase biotin carboxylase subunit n=1 Tax=Propionispora sp. 2/2-37 TaxID=1677858 RepID=UPI0006BB5CE7|nr:acetyl-CoA carboxylase biotin carboxylase subunit [Propionispora sp. 2/2-37]CUH94389.1 Biotin carboxylase 1 [Propionispora sp. 2/2-37]